MVMENQQKKFFVLKKLNLSKFNTQKKNYILKLKTVLLIGGYGKIGSKFGESLKKNIK